MILQASVSNIRRHIQGPASWGRRLCKKMWGYLTVAHSQKVRRTFCAYDLVRGRTVQAVQKRRKGAILRPFVAQCLLAAARTCESPHCSASFLFLSANDVPRRITTATNEGQ